MIIMAVIIIIITILLLIITIIIIMINIPQVLQKIQKPDQCSTKPWYYFQYQMKIHSKQISVLKINNKNIKNSAKLGQG